MRLTGLFLSFLSTDNTHTARWKLLLYWPVWYTQKRNTRWSHWSAGKMYFKCLFTHNSLHAVLALLFPGFRTSTVILSFSLSFSFSLSLSLSRSTSTTSVASPTELFYFRCLLYPQTVWNLASPSPLCSLMRVSLSPSLDQLQRVMHSTNDRSSVQSRDETHTHIRIYTRTINWMLLPPSRSLTAGKVENWWMHIQHSTIQLSLSLSFSLLWTIIRENQTWGY